MTAVTGLRAEEAARLLAMDGPNTLPQVQTDPRWRRFAAEFTHFFALLLWVAAALAFVAGMPQLGVAVIVVVIINGVFAFAQEARAERAASKLRAMLPAHVLVRRDGRPMQVEAAQVVRGDVVLLTAGDRIPGDLEFSVAEACTVDESMLSGESEPVVKHPGDVGYGGDIPCQWERRSFGYRHRAKDEARGYRLFDRGGSTAPKPVAHGTAPRRSDNFSGCT